MVPVSYTHLDVYKRQAFEKSNKIDIVDLDREQGVLNKRNIYTYIFFYLYLFNDKSLLSFWRQMKNTHKAPDTEAFPTFSNFCDIYSRASKVRTSKIRI